MRPTLVVPLKKNKFSASGRDRPKTVFQKKVRDFIKTQVSRTILWVKFNKLDRSPKACRKGNYQKTSFTSSILSPITVVALMQISTLGYSLQNCLSAVITRESCELTPTIRLYVSALTVCSEILAFSMYRPIPIRFSSKAPLDVSVIRAPLS